MFFLWDEYFFRFVTEWSGVNVYYYTIPLVCSNERSKKISYYFYSVIEKMNEIPYNLPYV